MADMATLGFMTAGMTIIGLLRVLFAFREIRRELLGQRADLADAKETIRDLTAAMAQMPNLERRLADLESRAAINDRAAQVASYDEAARRVQLGDAEDQLATRCGLSRGEARLVKALWSGNGDKREEAAAAR